MKKKTAKKIRKEEYDRWEKAEDEWRITSREARQRVRVIRDELEAYREHLEGAPFDIPCGDYEPPRSIGQHRRKHTVELVGDLNPIIDGLFKMIDDFADQHGCADYLDFNSKLFLLKMEAAETGFQIGLLAGAIFAGCSNGEIDRFERGLTFALCSDTQIVKD